MLKYLAVALLLTVVPVLAQAAADVPLPRERPEAMAASSSEQPASAASSSSEEPVVPLPEPRPDPSAVESSSSSEEPSSSASSEEPPPPPRDYQVACPSLMQGQVTGKALPPIHEGQCGLQSPLSLEAVSANGRSIPFSSQIITDCGMATALPAWVGEVDSYLFAHDKTGIKTINVSTNYECRNVDHAKTGNLSFHSFADALDIMGFTLNDGRTISIAPGFNGTPEQGRDILHFARDAACAHFMTVLGPDADSYHQDNMHLDLACHGKTCTTRLCE
jgi:hypothetical protein